MNENQGKIILRSCRDVQALLYDYTMREIGPAQSELVKEHIGRCERCRAELDSIQKTLAVLNLARDAPVPGRLSVSHRKRMAQAVMHPVLDWIRKHSFIATIVVTLLAVVLAIIALNKAMNPEPMEDCDVFPIELSPRPTQSVPVNPPAQPPLQEGRK